jgi:hypothetical protein
VTIKVYEDEGLLLTLKNLYKSLNLPTDWDNWDVDNTPITVPWAGTPSSSDPEWDDLFASTNKKILLALTREARGQRKNI